MKQIGNNIYVSFDYQEANSQDCQVRSIMLGPGGVGKSSLVNNLCHSSHKVGIQRKIITTKLEFQRSVYSANGLFCICDSAGISPETMKILVTGLTKYEWNTAFVEMKLGARIQIDTLPELMNIYKMFKSGTDRIIFLVSHLDLLNDPNQKEKILQTFKQSLDEYQITNKVILFSNLHSDFNKLSEILYSCSVGFEKSKFQLKPKFLSCLNDEGGQIIQQLVLPPLKQKQMIIKSDDQIKPNLTAQENAQKIQIPQISDPQQIPTGELIQKSYPHSMLFFIPLIPLLTVSFIYFFAQYKPKIDETILKTKNKQAQTKRESDNIKPMTNNSLVIVNGQLNQQCQITRVDQICSIQIRQNTSNSQIFNFFSPKDRIILDSVQVQIKPVEQIREIQKQKIIEENLRSDQQNLPKNNSKNLQKVQQLSNYKVKVKASAHTQTNFQTTKEFLKEIQYKKERNVDSAQRISRPSQLMQQNDRKRKFNERNQNKYQKNPHKKGNGQYNANENKNKSNFKNKKNLKGKGFTKNNEPFQDFNKHKYNRYLKNY